LADLVTPVRRAVLLTTDRKLKVEQRHEEVILHGLPKEQPTRLFPVIKLECAGKPTANQWGRERLWGGDPSRVAVWAARGARACDRRQGANMKDLVIHLIANSHLDPVWLWDWREGLNEGVTHVPDHARPDG